MQTFEHVYLKTFYFICPPLFNLNPDCLISSMWATTIFHFISLNCASVSNRRCSKDSNRSRPNVLENGGFQWILYSTESLCCTCLVQDQKSSGKISQTQIQDFLPWRSKKLPLENSQTARHFSTAKIFCIKLYIMVANNIYFKPSDQNFHQNIF